jgi:hypothetical protein
VAKTILVKGYSDDLRDAGTNDDAPPTTEPLRDAEVKPLARKGSVADLLGQAARVTA